MVKKYFKSLYKVEQVQNIVEISRLSLYYPNIVDEEKNRELFLEVNNKN